MNSIWVLLGIALLSSACVPSSIETTRLNAPPRPLVSRPPQSVEIYSSSPPARPHVDVALLRADQGNFGTDQQLVQSLAERAGQLGCDALFISGASHRPGAPGDLYLFDPGSRILLATCIAYYPQSSAEALAVGTLQAAKGNAIVLLPAEEQEPKSPTIVERVTTGSARR